MENQNNKVTIKQLREDLNKLEAKYDNCIVKVTVNQYNKAYPIAYIPLSTGNYYNALQFLDAQGKEVRLDIYLPDDEEKYMYTGYRKI